MNVLTLLLLCATLVPSQTVTRDVAIEKQVAIDSSRELIINSGKHVVPELPPEIENKPTKDGSDQSTAVVSAKARVLSVALSTIFKLASKGNELRKQFEFVIPTLVSMALFGGFSMNPFRLAGFLPYIILAMQKVNQPPTIERAIPGLDEFNIAEILEDPDALRKLFENNELSSVAIDSVKVVAGGEKVAAVEALMKGLSGKLKADGASGITGDNLVQFFNGSPAFESLVPGEMNSNAVNYINLLVALYLSPKSAGIKDEFVDRLKEIRKDRPTGASGSVDDAVRGTLADSSWAFLKVAKRIIDEKFQRLNANAERDVAEWKQKSAAAAGNNASYSSRFSNLFVNNAPESVLKMFARGNVMKTQYGGYVVPELASYFLPVGRSMDALKFICLITYVVLKAKKENMVPEPGKTDDASVRSGLNTEKIIQTLNNNDVMAKIFPIEQSSNYRVDMLKFLAGPEADIVDKIVDELKIIKKKKGGDQAQTKLTMADILTNTVFFKKLFTLKDYTGVKIKQYLGLDLGQLKNEIAEEMKKGPPDNSYLGAILPGYASNVVSATYRAGLRKATETAQGLNTEILKEADQMTKTPSSSEAADESTYSSVLRRVLNVTPRPVTYGLAGKRVLTNKVSSFLRNANSGVSDNGPVNVTPANRILKIS